MTMKKKKIKIDESAEVIADLKNSLARALADYDNLVKRMDKEREMMGVITKTRFVLQLLPGLDMLYDAQSHLNDAGLAMTIQTFEQVLIDEGFVKVTATPGDAFDETSHEAIELVDDPSHKDGSILEVTMVGWKRTDGTLVRPAKVKVTGKIQ